MENKKTTTFNKSFKKEETGKVFAEQKKEDKKNIKPVEKKKNEYIVNATLLNIRKEPSTDKDNVVDVYKANEIIEALEENESWVKTSKGWVMKLYLTKK